MSRYSGSQHRGAAGDQRAERRRAAQARDDTTTAERHQPEPTDLERDCS